MSYATLVEGYAGLMRRLFDDKAIFERLRNHMEAMGDPLPKFGFQLPEQLSITLRFLVHGVLLGGPRRWYYFLRSLPLSRGNVGRLVAMGLFLFLMSRSGRHGVLMTTGGGPVG